jgi:hypothetical protein
MLYGDSFFYLCLKEGEELFTAVDILAENTPKK